MPVEIKGNEFLIVSENMRKALSRVVKDAWFDEIWKEEDHFFQIGDSAANGEVISVKSAETLKWELIKLEQIYKLGSREIREDAAKKIAEAIDVSLEQNYQSSEVIISCDLKSAKTEKAA